MKTAIRSCCTLFLLTTSFAFSQTTGTSSATPAPTASSAAADPAAEASLQKMETELSQANAARDTAPFTKYLDDNIVALGPGWRANSKADVLEGIKSSPCASSHPTLSGFSFKWLTPDVVLLSYTENYTLTCQGKATPTTERDSSLWQKKHGSWLAVFHQATAELPSNTAGGV